MSEYLLRNPPSFRCPYINGCANVGGGASGLSGAASGVPNGSGMATQQQYDLTHFSSSVLSKIAFLCTVLHDWIYSTTRSSTASGLGSGGQGSFGALGSGQTSFGALGGAQGGLGVERSTCSSSTEVLEDERPSELDANHLLHLQFRLALYGLETPRPPASNRIMEVKLTNQECELVALLKRIPLGSLLTHPSQRCSSRRRYQPPPLRL